MKFNQQGDVLIIPCKIPAGAKRIKTNVLAQGEHTGHAHSVLEPELCNLKAYEYQGKIYIKGDGSIPVDHQEHFAQVVEPQEYVIERVQEFDHFAEEARQVAD